MLGLRTLVPLLATAIVLVAPAEATTSYYVGASNEAGFTAAIAGMTLLDPSLTFASTDLGTDGLFNASGTGINFLGFDDFNYPTVPESLTVISNQLTATNAGEHVTINFPTAGIYAFGFHITTTSGTAILCIELTHGTCDYGFNAGSSAGVQFFGIVSTTPIAAALDIRDQGTGLKSVLTNFEAYGPSDVPEPHTMLLVGLGLVILPLARRKLAVGLFR